MKYIKQFENKNEPSVGDYVVIRTSDYEFTRNYNEFLESHIGKITSIEGNYFYVDFLMGEPYNVSLEFRYNQVFHLRNLNFFAKSLPELELKMQANKYNL